MKKAHGEGAQGLGLRGQGWWIEPEDLAAFLKSQRWFGDKGGSIRDARIVEVIPVTWLNSQKPFAVARAKVAMDTGDSYYQLFLEHGGEPTDALTDAEFRRGLVDAFLKGATFDNGSTRWIVESESAQSLVVPASAELKLATSEQTNSSLYIDAEAILKLYRKLEPGINPDVEVTRFLTIQRGFVHVPVLLGTVRFEDSAGVTIAGMLQELVPGAVDGWTFALERARPYFAATEWREAKVPFESEATDLGVVTRALHDTLASGEPGSDFELQRAQLSDIRRWTESARQTFERALTTLERAVAGKRIPNDTLAAAQALLDRRRDYLAWIAELGDGIGNDAGAKTRTHGDYHLGQVLRSTADRFLIIDFEGEPARPLRERRERHSPLRDVAGMLRSVAYAAAKSSGLKAQGFGEKEAKALSPKPSQWESRIRAAFLRGYHTEQNGNPDLLPRSESNVGRLLALFEAEKIFYELQYELDHRPDWVWVPLTGIAKLIA